METDPAIPLLPPLRQVCAWCDAEASAFAHDLSDERPPSYGLCGACRVLLFSALPPARN